MSQLIKTSLLLVFAVLDAFHKVIILTLGELKGIFSVVHCLFYFTEFFSLKGLYFNLSFVKSCLQTKNSLFTGFSVVFDSYES